LLGIFGMLFGRENCRGGGAGEACRRMKAGVWVDLVGMLLWFASFVGELLFPLSSFLFFFFLFFFFPSVVGLDCG